jgi:nucleoside-diphosphate-sugar epimerase
VFRRSDIRDLQLSLFGEEAAWQRALMNVRFVVHLAAHAHKPHGADASAYWHVNVEGTRFVAHQAARAGVRRLIYLSSIKVNGEGDGSKSYGPQDLPNPRDAYGRSKRDAEDLLRKLCPGLGMELVVIRPPLIYGPGVRGNFYKLMRLAESGIPLALGSVRNRRSLLNVWNLADFVAHCMTDGRAANQTFLVADGEDISTPDLIEKLARLMRRPARLFRFPPRLLGVAGRLIGYGNELDRLCNSLLVDGTAARSTLDWSPPVSLDEGLGRTVFDFDARRRA